MLIEIPRFAGAYSAVDTTWLPSLGTGIVLPIGAGYVFYTYLKTREERKGRNRLLVWFYVLMTLEAAILIPWGVSRLRDVPLATVITPGIDWLWTAIVMVSPFLMASAVVNGIALQVVKQKATTEEEVKPKHKPTTYEEFVRLYPNILEMTNEEIREKTGNAISVRTGTNWKLKVRNNGNHA